MPQYRLCTFCHISKPTDDFPGLYHPDSAARNICLHCHATVPATDLAKKKQARIYRHSQRRKARPIPGPRFCRGCDTTKEPDEFFPGIALCLRCTGLQAIAAKRGTKEQRSTTQKTRIVQPPLLTPETYAALLLKQQGVCAICHESSIDTSSVKRRLAIDHDHATNAIRGLLCHSCNMGLGSFKDDIVRLRNAVRYLQRTGRMAHKPATTRARNSQPLLIPFGSDELCTGPMALSHQASPISSNKAL